jgi:indolepyruvate ferredoxin oxidoreductase beta subunit
MSKVHSLLFAGVGGQGSLFIAELTSLAAVHAGYDVKQTEVHGVSQRGGSVETHVRFGEKVHSPIVTPGQADALIFMEKLEGLRFAHFINPNGTILINDYEIIPGSVAKAEELYPHEVIDHLRDAGLPVVALPATQIAYELGNGRMANVVMLGALSTFLPIPPESWEKSLQMRLPPRFLDANLQAFQAGQQVAQPVRSGASTHRP